MSYVRTGLGAALSTTVESSVGSSLLTAAPFTGPAAPFVAAAGAIADMLASFGVGAGCGQSCVLSSDFANQAEAQLQQNISNYFAIAPPRPASAQAAAVANAQTILNWIQQQCSNPQLGSAGQQCISDRMAGGCTWKQTAAKLPPWGTPPVGACWNWVNGYLDPIANDPNVVPDAQASTAASTTTPAAGSTAASAGLPTWAWIAAAALVVWAVM